jgi:hypothetical protein
MMPKKRMNQTGLQVLKATVGIRSDARDLLPKFPLQIEVKSLLTDFRDMTEIPYSTKLDGQIVLENKPGSAAFLDRSNRKVLFRGPLRKLEAQASDLRYSLWGNQGFLYRFILYLLEERHHIFSLHACALYDEKRNLLYIAAGGAGSGKTVYLLSGIAKGLKLFSTETAAYECREKKITWFKGSLVDNVRLGTLVHDFPQFLPRLDRPSSPGQVWQKKITLDLSSHQCSQDALVQPDVVLLFPRIEEGRKGFLFNVFEDKRRAAKAVFDNLSQKIAETIVLYDRLPVCGLDEARLAASRLESACRLVENSSVVKIAAALSGPADCWGDLLDKP